MSEPLENVAVCNGVTWAPQTEFPAPTELYLVVCCFFLALTYSML